MKALLLSSLLFLGPLPLNQERLGPAPQPGGVGKREDLTGGSGPRLGDFRPYVFGAYSVVAVLLLLYCVRLAARQRALRQELEALEERLRK